MIGLKVSIFAFGKKYTGTIVDYKGSGNISIKLDIDGDWMIERNISKDYVEFI